MKKQQLMVIYLEVQNQKGCGKFLKYKGNIDVWCGLNSCNSIRLADTDMVIEYCDECNKEEIIK